MIKRQLSVMLPGVKIFLDVDDLDDVSKIAEHVKASSLVLCFLSRGYFLSAPCMTEVRVAIANGKPIVAVHEEDDQHGGAPLDEIFDDCPPDIQRSDIIVCSVPKVASNVISAEGGELPIPWLRSKPMQRASLALIAEALMRALSKESKSPPRKGSGWGAPVTIQGGVTLRALFVSRQWVMKHLTSLMISMRRCLAPHGGVRVHRRARRLTINDR